jgi:hypothetical protein
MIQVYNQSVANWEGFIPAIEKAIAAAPPYQSVEVNNGLREAAEQALEALRYHVAQTRPINRTEEAINALMQALAAPKGEE